MPYESLLIQVVLVLLLAPLVQGVIKNTKARFQSRRGPGYLQPYYDYAKFLRKDYVVSPTVSWVFHVAPYIYFGAAVAAALFVPTLMSTGVTFNNLFILVYVFALGRFFLAAASLDAGSAFGGMGGSREMYIAVLVEPILMLTLFSVAMGAQTTTLSGMAAWASGTGLTFSGLLAALAFLIVLVAETGRIPVDNPDTHLELTMIHEGMVLEYSGRPTGLIFWAASVKQLVLIVVFVNLFVPWVPPFVEGTVLSGALFALKVLATAVLLAAIETSTNKIRLFRAPGLLAAGGVLALLALAAQ